MIQALHTENIGLAPPQKECSSQSLQMTALTMIISRSWKVDALKKPHDLNIPRGMWNIRSNGGTLGVTEQLAPSTSKKLNEVFTYRQVYNIVRWLNQSSFGRRQHMFYMLCSQTTLCSWSGSWRCCWYQNCRRQLNLIYVGGLYINCCLLLCFLVQGWFKFLLSECRTENLKYKLFSSLVLYILSICRWWLKTCVWRASAWFLCVKWTC